MIVVKRFHFCVCESCNRKHKKRNYTNELVQKLFCFQLRAIISVLLIFFSWACSKVPYIFNLLSVLSSVCCDVHTRLKMNMLRDLEVASVS